MTGSGYLMKKPLRPADASEAEKLRKQRAALARFGQHALRTNDLDELLHEASVNVSEAMEIDLVKVLQLMPDGETMLLRAGVNWNPGVVGHATFGAHSQSPAGYALHTDKPVISPDVALEKRFEIPELLWQHGVTSMVNVVIRGERQPFGVLEVDSRQKRDFDEEDISFLHTYANLLASAVDRLTTHRELEEAAETSAILVRELQHRVMNILANIGALARRTRASSASLDDFMKAFESRLGALGRAQDLLTRGSMRGAGIRELLSRELSAHGVDEGKRVTVKGAEIQLPPKFLQALSILFHELATNAVKHGALDVENGRIEVFWRVEPSDAGDRLLIRWRETGVEINGKPSRRGLGLEAIEVSLPYMLAATSLVVFHRDGVECTVECLLPDDGPSRDNSLLAQT
jgi:two-component sensor histidine kinase